jgi:hypothetical protein
MKSELPYEEWLLTIDRMTTRWRLWRLECYRLALYLAELSFLDLDRITEQEPDFDGNDFLLQATKIGAKIAFGHGPGFRTIQLEGFNEALASSRAARHWYELCWEWLGDSRTRHRLQLIDIITNNLLLLTQVPPGFDPVAYDDEHWDAPIEESEYGEWEEDDSNDDLGNIPF